MGPIATQTYTGASASGDARAIFGNNYENVTIVSSGAESGYPLVKYQHLQFN